MSKKDTGHTDILQIRSTAQLWNDIVIEGLKKNHKRDAIRLNLIDAIRKEVFGLMMNRLKVDDLRAAAETPENQRKVANIAIQARNKWRSLMRLCDCYEETKGIIGPDDLKEIFPEEEEDDEDDGYEFEDAEDPEEDEENA